MQIELNEKDWLALVEAAKKVGTTPQAFAARAIRERITKVRRGILRYEREVKQEAQCH